MLMGLHLYKLFCKSTRSSTDWGGQAGLVRKYVDRGFRCMCLVGGDGADTSRPAVEVGRIVHSF